MEKIIEKFNYAKGTDRTEEKLSKEIYDCVEKFAPELKLDGMKKIISTFIEKVCVRPFPDNNSPSYYMSKMTATIIIQLMEACVSTHKTMTKVQCQDLLFDVIVELMAKGQGVAHYELMTDILVQFNMEGYIEKLEGEQLKRLLDAFKQQKGMEDKSSYRMIIEYAMGKKNKSKRRKPDVQAEFLDLYIFFLVQITKNPYDLASDLVYCQTLMWSTPYIGCTDVELYKRHIGIIKDVLSKKTFPRNEYEIETAYEVFDNLLDGAAKDAAVVKAIWTDLAEFFTKMASDSKAEKLQKVIERYGLFNERITKETLKSDPNMFTTWAPKISEILEKGADTKIMNTILPRQILDMLDKSNPVSGHEVHWIQILKGLLRYPQKEISNVAKCLIHEDKLKKIWNWKKNIEEAKKIMTITSKADVPLEEGEGWDNSEIAGNYGKTIHELFEQLKLVKVSHLVMPEMALLIISSLEKRGPNVNAMLYECSGDLEFKKCKDVIPGFLKRFAVLYCDPKYPWDAPWTPRVGIHVLETIVKAYKDSKELPPDVNKSMTRILNFSMDDNTERVDFVSRGASFYGQTVMYILNSFVQLHCDGNTPDQLSPIIPGIFNMMEDDNEDTTPAANSAFQLISSKVPTALKQYFERLVNRYLDTLDNATLNTLYQLYQHNTGAMPKLFQRIISTFGKEKDNDYMLLTLMWQVSEKQPEIFTKQNVNALLNYLDEQTVQHQVLQIWDKVVEKNPDLLLDQVDIIMQKKDLPLTCIHYTQGILSSIVVKHKKYLTPVLEWMIEWTKHVQDQMTLSVYIGMRKIADNYGPEPFSPYREYLEGLKAKKSSYVKDSVSNLIDVLENRSLEVVSTDVKQVKGDVEVLDERVTDTQIVVGGVVQQVERHEGEIKDVKKGVAKVNKRVDVVEEDLGDVKEKVEEIDMKTMSNAPAWSRDVTKLLNRQSDHDWRLLASRLGYTNEDIRAWATQSDPCMALLSEWYATHKTREATNGVLSVLQEMNRVDAAVIVENAMKVAEDVVEDEDFEYPSPPPIFLSYQWGHQNEVKLLRKHLQMAGYECWMDIGQMGGGDKLFEKIDAGIRGAKVVICCITDKYAKSPNCNREVNLAVNLRKPMIPLQMEKIEWPPIGSMGPIFSEYLYIRFYAGGAKGGKYWADNKFQELLMQLQMNNVVPDEKLLAKEYKNWWIPVAEEIVIEKKDNKSVNKSSKGAKDKKEDSKKGNDEPPDVFLSYQWDKQKQIQALFQRLTGLGFRCWMDIHQMGGGDSLYDKIDRGVRGCKVMLSSVTSKYALSANCRREVSLADALRKPIIPLLLEDIDWPPSGPMSLVFTRILYINFCKDSTVQMKWTGSEFNELIKQLKEHIPQLLVEDSVDNSKLKAAKGKETVGVTTNTKNEQIKAANLPVEEAKQKEYMSAVKVSEANQQESANRFQKSNKSSKEKSATQAKQQESLQKGKETVGVTTNTKNEQVKSANLQEEAVVATQKEKMSAVKVSETNQQESSNRFQKSNNSSKEGSATQAKQQESLQKNPNPEDTGTIQPKTQAIDNTNTNTNNDVGQDTKQTKPNGSTNEKSSTCEIL